MRGDVTWAYARELLERLTGTRPDPDGDGDLPVVVDGTPVWVSVVFPHDAVLQVSAVAVQDVEIDVRDGAQGCAELLRAVNERNRASRFCRWWLAMSGPDPAVWVAVDLWGDDLTPVNLRHAVELVAEEASRGGSELAERFGGRAPRAEAAEPPPSLTAVGAGIGSRLEPSPYL